MSLDSEILSFFDRPELSVAGRRLLVAFSGGPDSTALLCGLRRLAPRLHVDLHAAHIDHGLDGDSSRRAARAADICERLGVELTVSRLEISGSLIAEHGREAAARLLRYRQLETLRQRLAADFVVTAHHADDQAETVLIRLLHGTGIEGLTGIRACHDRMLRPLLGLPRSDLLKELRDSKLRPVVDPTNLRLDSLRNRVRHLLVPELGRRDPAVVDRLARLAHTAADLRLRLQTRLETQLSIRSQEAGATLHLPALVALPRSLWPQAVACLHRAAGLHYPPSAVARRELERQLDAGSRISVDCGDGWRWRARGRHLTLARPSPPLPGFAYTVEAPGECEIRELGLRFRLRRGAVDGWMFRPSRHRAGLDLPIGPDSRVVVRNRREGDRVRPFGCSYTRRLKDVLIDARVPRRDRSRLPLLEVDSHLAWVPGVTVGDAFRVEPGIPVWIAELESIEDDGY